MSHSVDEAYEVYDERFPRARKDHKCDACSEPIRRGDRYATIFVLFDGDVENYKRCLRCQTLHEHLRRLAPGDTWPAEMLDCGEEYTQHWGTEPPPDIARLAFMTPDEAQKELERKLLNGT